MENYSLSNRDNFNSSRNGVFFYHLRGKYYTGFAMKFFILTNLLEISWTLFRITIELSDPAVPD